MANTLATILNDAAGRALVEKYIDRKFLERQEWEGVLANSQYLSDRGVPKNEGQYVQFTRLGRFRRPQTMDRSTGSNEVADPASGAVFSTEVVQVPVEYLQEYIDVSTVASWTSWVDLDAWVNEDLPMALKRRVHELVQNAFVVGRFKPGQWAANGTASTAFDATVEKTVTLDAVSFTFKQATSFYGNGKATFGDLVPGDRILWADLDRQHTKLSLAGATKIGGFYIAFISDAVKNDLIRADEYFQAAIRSFDAGTKSLSTNDIASYKGWRFVIDDQPFTEALGAESVRATNGQVHSCILTGKGAAGFINLGSKRTPFKPSFKVQDISKTGVQKTIGYLVPNQQAVLNEKWCSVLKTPVSEWLPMGA